MPSSFASLHQSDTPLLLPNAWDVPSALAFVEAGFEAVGTTSFGVATSVGRPDGARATREANVTLARALSSLPCHISVDIEDGYADDPDTVAEYVAQLGVAGINIEDSTTERLIPPEAHAAKVAAIKERAPDVFVNARVDTYCCIRTRLWRRRSNAPRRTSRSGRTGCSSRERAKRTFFASSPPASLYRSTCW